MITPKSNRQKLVRVLVISLLFWGAMVATFTIATWLDVSRWHAERAFTDILTVNIKGYLPWIFLTPAVFLFARDKRPRQSNPFMEAARALALLAGAYLMIAAYVFFVRYLENKMLGATTFGEVGVATWLQDVWLFCFIYLAGRVVGINEIKNRELVSRLQLERENALAQAEIANLETSELRYRFSSHFMLNAFANILGMMRAQNFDAARDATALLSNILKGVAGGADAGDLVAIKDEISFLGQYIEFQKIRFPTVDYQETIDEASRTHSIPRHILQPLVENAFKHGMRRSGELAILLNIAVRDQRVEIMLENTVPENMLRDKADGEGLRLTRLRLERAFGAQFSFESSFGENRFSVHISYPAASAK